MAFPSYSSLCLKLRQTYVCVCMYTHTSTVPDSLLGRTMRFVFQILESLTITVTSDAVVLDVKPLDFHSASNRHSARGDVQLKRAQK